LQICLVALRCGCSVTVVRTFTLLRSSAGAGALPLILFSTFFLFYVGDFTLPLRLRYVTLRFGICSLLIAICYVACYRCVTLLPFCISLRWVPLSAFLLLYLRYTFRTVNFCHCRCCLPLRCFDFVAPLRRFCRVCCAFRFRSRVAVCLVPLIHYSLLFCVMRFSASALRCRVPALPVCARYLIHCY